MSVNAASADTSERDRTRRIDVTTIRISCIVDFAETELSDDAVGFKHRGGWIYLAARGTR